MEESEKLVSKQKLLMPLIVSVVGAVVFTIIVKVVDVQPIVPEGSSVGLSSLNQAVRGLFSYGELGYNELWYKITKYTGYAIVGVAGVMLFCVLCQLIRRRKMRKLDCELKLLVPFYLVAGAVYLVFEKLLIVNYRPILLGGELEASYPSSHTLLALTICGLAVFVVRRLLTRRNAKLALLVSVVLVGLALVTVFGRLFSGVHWFTDIFGGVLMAAAIISGYTAAMKLGAGR